MKRYCKVIRSVFIAVFLVSCSFTAKADQLEAILEIEYEHSNERHIVFLPDDYWLFQSAENPAFDNLFISTYGNREVDSLIVYTHLIDQTSLAKKANFPIKKYVLPDSAQIKIALSDMEHIQFRKTYKQSGYTNIVFTELGFNDTTWIGGDFERLNLGHDDVGCRVYVYVLEHQSKQTALIKKLYTILPENGKFPSKEQQKQMRSLADQLKKHRSVVVMACGC